MDPRRSFAALLRQLAVRLGYDLLQRRGVRRRGVVGAGAFCRVGDELVTVEAGLGAQVGRVGGLFASRAARDFLVCSSDGLPKLETR